MSRGSSLLGTGFRTHVKRRRDALEVGSGKKLPMVQPKITRLLPAVETDNSAANKYMLSPMQQWPGASFAACVVAAAQQGRDASPVLARMYALQLESSRRMRCEVRPHERNMTAQVKLVEQKLSAGQLQQVFAFIEGILARRTVHSLLAYGYFVRQLESMIQDPADTYKVFAVGSGYEKALFSLCILH